MQLHKNSSLEYDFSLISKKPGVDLKIQRSKGENVKCWLNSTPISLDNLNQKVDIIFLTEDDPKKVVNASIGKLGRYFNTLERGIGSLQTALMTHLREIDEFREFKAKEKEIAKDVATCLATIEEKKRSFEDLSEKLKQLQKKNEIKEKLRLLSEKDQITRKYETLKKAYTQLCTKKDDDIARNLYKERAKLTSIDNDIKNIDRSIKQICDSLRSYGVPLDEKKLQRNDYSELNAINERIRPQKKEETYKMQMIDEFLELLRHHLDKEIVPVIEKTVAETRTQLMKIKAQLASDRVFGLVRALNDTMKKKKESTGDFEKRKEKISTLIQKNDALKDLEKTQREYLQAEEKYLALRVALNDDRSELLSVWEKVSLIEGDPEEIETQLHDLEIEMSTQDTLKNRYSESLRVLRANSIGKPEYYEREQKIKVLYETVFKLKGKAARWMEILRNPESAKEQYNKEQENQVFGKADYKKFISAVGEYLGSQFEPIPFDYKQHNVKFFDIERNVFITREDREIHIANLSQGQSKITSLTGSFRKMDPNKKKIVLIDEISELDPQNLENVKETLKDKLEEGSLLLAVLVRPSSETIRIKKWD
jgi:predicted house-cleaning noncanonical NTP pyrophosphatase (MazG superfamily)